MREKESSKKAINLLDLKPVQNREWVEIDNELLAILQPRFTNRILKRCILPLLRNPDIKIRLDAYGSFVWRHCSGEYTVRQIADCLKERFGSSVEPVLDRLELFLKYLERYEFIKYTNISELK